MDYDYIKQIIPEKRPFFTESNGIFAFSSGMLLVLENDDTNEWYNAIC